MFLNLVPKMQIAYDFLPACVSVIRPGPAETKMVKVKEKPAQQITYSA